MQQGAMQQLMQAQQLQAEAQQLQAAADVQQAEEQQRATAAAAVYKHFAEQREHQQ
jgi:hypothetical protein